MKHLKFILSNLIVCILLASYTACSSDNNSGDEPTTNPIEKEYFSITGAQYINQELPSGTDDLTAEISTTKHVVNGGSVIITILSEKALSKANVTTDNIKGYYQVELKPTTRDASADSYEYDIILNVIQSIKAESFKVSISVEDNEGKISTVNTSSDVNIVEAGTGKLQISLSWDQLDDLDLHVFTPNGHEISFNDEFFINPTLNQDSIFFEYYKYILEQKTGIEYEKTWKNNQDLSELMKEFRQAKVKSKEEAIWAKGYTSKYKAMYGLLDIDSNAGCGKRMDSINNENIYFSQLIKGTYIVAVDLYSRCEDRPRGTKYSVSAFLDGRPLTISDKQIGRFAGGEAGGGNYDEPEGYHIIGEFTINEGIELPKETKSVRSNTESDHKKMKANSRFQ